MEQSSRNVQLANNKKDREIEGILCPIGRGIGWYPCRRCTLENLRIYSTYRTWMYSALKFVTNRIETD